jgi:hypothetical protein
MFSASVIAILAVSLPLGALAQSAGQPGRNRVDPCSLLTAADAQHIAGMPMKPVPPLGGDIVSRFACNYEQAESTSAPKGEINFVVGQHKSKDMEDATWVAMKGGGGSSGNLDTQGLAGIGDDAFLIHGKVPGALSTTLFVRKGTSDFRLQAKGFKSEPLAPMKDIAKRIADEL